MAVYNNDDYLHFNESIMSLLNQTYLPSEIVIVVDGFVRKEINNILEQYYNEELFSIIKLVENKGLANALNIGIKSAKFDLIARMDADDICFPERLEKQIEFMNKENLDIVGGQIIEFGKNVKDIISVRKVPSFHKDIIKFLKLRSPFSHATILFRKEVFNTLEGYSKTVFPEDYDFFVEQIQYFSSDGSNRRSV
jgi:glycosyltransferase involved in cell wall biosynthesis